MPTLGRIVVTQQTLDKGLPWTKGVTIHRIEHEWDPVTLKPTGLIEIIWERED